MNNETYKKLKEINNLLWRVCNDEYIRREALKRKKEKKKTEKQGDDAMCEKLILR